MTLEDTRTHEELARMDREAENAAERMGRQTGREDVMSDRDRAERYKTLLEDARRERDEYRFRAETAEKATAEQAKEIERLKSIWKQYGLYCFMPDATPEEVAHHMADVAASWIKSNQSLNARVQTLEDAVFRMTMAAETLAPKDSWSIVRDIGKAALNPQQETPHA